jgi:hypothetical protein
MKQKKYSNLKTSLTKHIIAISSIYTAKRKKVNNSIYSMIKIF